MSKIDLTKYQNTVKFIDNPMAYERFTVIVYNTDNHSILASRIIPPNDYGNHDVNDLMSQLSPELLGVEKADISSANSIVSSFFSYKFPDDYMMQSQFIMTSKDWIVRGLGKNNTDSIPENIQVVFNHISGEKDYLSVKDSHFLKEKNILDVFIEDVKSAYNINSKMFNYITFSISKKLTGLKYMEAVIKEVERFEEATANSD